MKNKDKYNSLEDAQNAFEDFCENEKAKRFEETGFHACGSCPIVGKHGGCFNNWLFTEA